MDRHQRHFLQFPGKAASLGSSGATEPYLRSPTENGAGFGVTAVPREKDGSAHAAANERDSFNIEAGNPWNSGLFHILSSILHILSIDGNKDEEEGLSIGQQTGVKSKIT
jgi:hypothetical protein